MSCVEIFYTKYNLKILVALNIEGIIEGFKVKIDDHKILVYLKYNLLNKCMLFRNTKLVSTPGRRHIENL